MICNAVVKPGRGTAVSSRKSFSESAGRTSPGNALEGVHRTISVSRIVALIMSKLSHKDATEIVSRNGEQLFTIRPIESGRIRSLNGEVIVTYNGIIVSSRPRSVDKEMSIRPVYERALRPVGRLTSIG